MARFACQGGTPYVPKMARQVEHGEHLSMQIEHIDNEKGVSAWIPVMVKVVAVIALMAATGFGFYGRTLLLVSEERPVTLLFYWGVWAVSLGALIVAALQPRLSVRLFWAAVIAITTAAGWAYQAVSGSSLNVFDVLSLWTARHEAGRAMGEYGAVLPSALLTLLATFLIIALPARLPYAWMRRVAGWLFFVPAAPVAIIAAIIFLRHGGGSQALPTQFQPLAVSMVAMERQLIHARPARMAVPFSPARKPRIRHIVFLVGESIRADYLDFTPGNRFTPHLPALMKTAANFGRAVSGGNCSSYSNAILRFTAQRHDMVKSVNGNPTLWQWAKKAGFRTVYIDGQSGFIRDPGFLQNFMTMRETRFIDEIVRFNGTPMPKLDFALLEKVKKLLKSKQPVFIYANKDGAHFPYDKTYPAASARFHPTIGELGKETLRSKVNSYRNAIAWNIDHFFERLLKEVDLSDTLIIYTSDHGQNLDPARLTHCSTEDPHPREGLVPMLAITGNAALLERFRQAAAMNTNATTHFNIAPTLLLMMGYDRKALDALYGPSLLDRLPRQPLPAFSYGDIFGLFSDEVHWQTVDPNADLLEMPLGEARQQAMLGKALGNGGGAPALAK